MPDTDETRTMTFVWLLAQKTVSKAKAKVVDHRFLQAVTRDAYTPQYGGYNTTMVRSQGICRRPNKGGVYTAYRYDTFCPDTMLTAMHEAQMSAVKCGVFYGVHCRPKALQSDAEYFVGTAGVISKFLYSTRQNAYSD